MMNDDKDLLSQEEIDSLMDIDLGEESLTAEEKDVLGEIGNISMGSAATALYTILDQKVEITAPEVKLRTFKDVTKEYERPCVLVKVKYISGLKGVNLLIIKEEDAAVIADLMMGGDGSNKEVNLDDIHISAVGEAMNQMMGASSTAVSSIIEDVVNITPPETEYLDLDEALENKNHYFEADKLLVSTSFQLKVGNLIDSRFKQLAPIGFAKQLVSRLMENESGGLTAKGDSTTSQEQVAAITEKDLNSRKLEEKQKRETRRISAPAGNRTGGVEKEEVGVQVAQFPDFDTTSAEPIPQNMELIKDVPLQVTVRLGKTRMTIKEILDLGEGSIVELDKLAGEPVDLLVNGKLVAKGEVVVIDENFGFRVKDIINPMDRINNI